MRNLLTDWRLWLLWLAITALLAVLLWSAPKILRSLQKKKRVKEFREAVKALSKYGPMIAFALNEKRGFIGYTTWDNFQSALLKPNPRTSVWVSTPLGKMVVVKTTCICTNGDRREAETELILGLTGTKFEDVSPADLLDARKALFRQAQGLYVSPATNLHGKDREKIASFSRRCYNGWEVWQGLALDLDTSRAARRQRAAEERTASVLQDIEDRREEARHLGRPYDTDVR